MRTGSIFGVSIVLVLLFPLLAWAANSDADDNLTAIKILLEKKALQEQQDLEQRGLLLRDDALSKSLVRITQKLWQQADVLVPRLQVLVLISMKEEAFVYPNGICYLSTGLLGSLDNEDQLAMAIAHEMVHYIREHTLRAYCQLRPDLSAKTTLQFSPIRGNWNANKHSFSTMLMSAELEADREGLALMAAAGYHSHEALRLIDRLRFLLDGYVEDATAKQKVAAMLNQRRAALKEMIAAMPGPVAPPSADDQGFQRMLAPVLLANAQAAVAAGNWRFAKDNIDRCLKTSAEEPRAYYLLGETLLQQSPKDGVDEAMQFFRKAIALNKDYPPPYRAIGIMQLKSGHPAEACNYLKTYLSLAPEASERQYIQEYLRIYGP
jgi:predicted Zn-dependent protease